MIINSDFRDYYDHCVGYGVDKALVYDRRSVQIETVSARNVALNREPRTQDIMNAIMAFRDQVPHIATHPHSIAVLGFCGRLYAGLAYRNRGRAGMLFGTPSHKDIVPVVSWREEDLSDFEKNMQGVRTVFSLGAAKSPLDWFSRSEGKREADALSLFINHGLVSFYLEGTTLVINPCLRDINFQKRMDGITAFQEISQHLASLSILNVPQPDPISDELRAQTKGFDSKSFRKGPEGKRK